MGALPTPLVALWVSQALSLIGSDLTRFGVGIWAYKQSEGSVGDFAWVTVCGEAPALLLAPLTGLLVDRVVLRRRWLIAAADWASLAASLWLWRRYADGTLSVRDVWVANAAQSVAASVQWPAFMATVTALVPPADLVRVGAVNEAITALVMLLAPSAAGAVLAWSGEDLTLLFAIEAVTCAAATVTLGLWAAPRDATAGSAAGQGGISQSQTPGTDSGSCDKGVSSGTGVRGSAAEDAGGGAVGAGATAAPPPPPASSWLSQGFYAAVTEPVRFVLGRPALAQLLLLTAGFSLVNGLVRILFTPLIMAFSGASAVAMVLTLSGTGAIAGSVALGSAAPARPVRAMLGCSAAQGALLAAVGIRPSTWLVLAVAFAYMALIPPVRVCRQAVLQRETPAGLQGRIFALQRAIREGCVPLAGLVAGPVGDKLEGMMATEDASALASAAGPWIGVGKGRGVAALFVCVGTLYAAVSVAAMASPTLASLDDGGGGGGGGSSGASCAEKKVQ